MYNTIDILQIIYFRLESDFLVVSRCCPPENTPPMPFQTLFTPENTPLPSDKTALTVSSTAVSTPCPMPLPVDANPSPTLDISPVVMPLPNPLATSWAPPNHLVNTLSCSSHNIACTGSNLCHLTICPSPSYQSNICIIHLILV